MGFSKDECSVRPWILKRVDRRIGVRLLEESSSQERSIYLKFTRGSAQCQDKLGMGATTAGHSCA